MRDELCAAPPLRTWGQGKPEAVRAYTRRLFVQRTTLGGNCPSHDPIRSLPDERGLQWQLKHHN
jgi:hypothetical protein